MSGTEPDNASRRIWRFVAGLTAAGVAWAAWQAGAAGMLGFAAGAGFSAINLWSWHRIVHRVGRVETPGEAPYSASTVLFGLRYFLFAGGAYVILRYFEGSLPAALAGCFVAPGAVILEILFELIYGT